MELTIRGIGIEHLVRYLEKLGASPVKDQEPGSPGSKTPPESKHTKLKAEHWSVTLDQHRVAIGSLSLREVTLDFHGDEDVLSHVVSEFRRMCQRAGG